MSVKTLSRRKFLSLLGFTSAGAGLAACARFSPSGGADSSSTPTPMSGMEMHAGTPGGGADDMDAMHKAGIDIFVGNAGKDPTFWPRRLDYRLEGDTKVFEVTCTEGKWEIASGQSVDAMLYNGGVPGPEIRVTEGDKVRVVCTNQMTQSTAIHFHGVKVPNAMDGVPFITQDPIKPGGSFTYEFTARNPGSHMYHSHHNAAEQVTKGLLGPFIIEPKDKSREPAVDADYTLILNDTGLGLTFNGKSFPYTQPIIVKLGDVVRIRYMNEGVLIHPMHLHGLPQTVIAKDGWPVPQPWQCDTLNVAPGERYDVIVTCDEPGIWAFHCHILTHAESAHGMFGMVTALIVNA